MRETGLAKATCHVGVLGISHDDLKHSESLRGSCGVIVVCGRQKRIWELTAL